MIIICFFSNQRDVQQWRKLVLLERKHGLKASIESC